MPYGPELRRIMRNNPYYRPRTLTSVHIRSAKLKPLGSEPFNTKAAVQRVREEAEKIKREGRS